MRSKTVIATPPGATIKEQLVDRGMSQKEFAVRMDMSEKHISRLINGEVQLTSDVAMRLEMVLGLPAHFWSNLENIYREKLVKAQAENEMDADLETAKKIPYNEMAKNGWVQETRNGIERVINLRKFFEEFKNTKFKNAYVTVRDDSLYEFDKDYRNKVLARVTKRSYNMAGYGENHPECLNV